MHNTSVFAWGVVLALGCSQSVEPGPGPAFTGSDPAMSAPSAPGEGPMDDAAIVDAGRLAKMDAAQAGPDAAPTPTADSGAVGVDAAAAPRDSGATAGTAGSDPRAGYIGCGDVSCQAPDVCCVSQSGLACAGSCSGFLSASGTCDGTEDCGGQACCVKFGFGGGPNGSFCRASCARGDHRLCHVDADCTAGQTCERCAPPTGGIIDLVYGVCSTGGRCPSPFSPAR